MQEITTNSIGAERGTISDRWFHIFADERAQQLETPKLAVTGRLCMQLSLSHLYVELLGWCKLKAVRTAFASAAPFLFSYICGEATVLNVRLFLFLYRRTWDKGHE